MLSSCATGRFIATPISTPRRCSTPRCSCGHAPMCFSPDRFPAWKVMWNRSRRVWWRVRSRRRDCAASPYGRSRARQRSGRSAITFRTPIRGGTSRRTLRSICFRRSIPIRATARNARPRFAGWLWKGWTSTWRFMSELARAIEDFLAGEARRNDSPHTLRNYGADLDEFLAYFSPPGTEPPMLAAIDLLSLREWLAHLYDRGQKPATIRRKLASLRSLFRFLSREHRLEGNPARLLRLPKMPQTLPEVPNTEVTNALIDGSLGKDLERPFPRRDRLLLELLYGAGLRVSEAVGLNLEDFDRTERWIRVRGKGRKERQTPYGMKAAEALDAWLNVRLKEGEPDGEPHALFLNRLGGRLTDR